MRTDFYIKNASQLTESEWNYILDLLIYEADPKARAILDKLIADVYENGLMHQTHGKR